MPTYEFRCPDGTVIERKFKISDVPEEIPAPDGSGMAVRMISGGAALLFKGSGFYITDYGKDGKKDQRANAAGAKSETGKGESSSSGEGGATAKGDASSGGSEKSEGAKRDGAKNDGAKSEGTKSEGAKSDGAKREGTKSEGTKSEGAKTESNTATPAATPPRSGGGSGSSGSSGAT